MGATSPATVSWAIVFVAAMLVPIALTALTAFAKISTVLQIVRVGLGAQDIPSRTVLLALSMALTWLVMTPMVTSVAERAAPAVMAADTAPVGDTARALREALEPPMRSFLAANAKQSERDRFATVARANAGARAADVTDRDFAVLVPAFVVSELMRAFTLGLALLLPFAIVDLALANVLAALGWTAVNPTQVAIACKLLLFLAVDGWGVVSRALASGYKF
ncbi:MAG: EscR/YscR/HrcR family type III secretion system export apparatus protein [Polyangiales bacterium]